jgi:hypothetical protein
MQTMMMPRDTAGREVDYRSTCAKARVSPQPDPEPDLITALRMAADRHRAIRTNEDHQTILRLTGGRRWAS